MNSFHNKIVCSVLLLFGCTYLGLAQCPAGQVPITIEIDTDNFGSDVYWELQPSSVACGSGAPILAGGNTTQVNCFNGGSNTASSGNGYPNNSTIASPQICLLSGTSYNLYHVDSWADGSTTFRVLGAGGIVLQTFVATGASNTFTFTPEIDALIDSVSVGQYKRMPYSQITSVPLAAKLLNAGDANLSGVTITADVFEAGNPSPVFTATSGATSVNVTNSTVVTVGSWTPPASPITTYTIEYSTSTVAGDVNIANNSLSEDMAVTAAVYARDDDNQTSAIGAAGVNFRLGNNFDIVNAEELYDAEAFIVGGVAGDTVLVEIYNTNAAGVPTTLVGRSTPVILSGPASSLFSFSFATPLSLTPGEYTAVAYYSATVSGSGIGTADNIFAAGKSWLKTGGSLWVTAESQGFNLTFIVRPILPTNDLSITTVTNPHPEYTIIPETQFSGPLNMEAVVTNNGNEIANNITVTTDVFSAANLSTPIATFTSTPTNIAAGASSAISTGTYTPTTPDTYIFEHRINSNRVDIDTSDNTGATFFTLSEGTYARDDGNVTGSLGIGPNATPGVYDNGILGQNFQFINNGRIDSITAVFNAPTTGDSIRIAIYNTVSSGTPNIEIASTDAYIFTAADAGGVTLTLPVTGGPLSLTAGTYFVGVREYDENFTLATSTNIFTTGTSWARWDDNPNGANAWSLIEGFGFNVAYVLRPNVLIECAALTTSSTATDATCAAADGSASITASGTVAPYSYLWSNGATTSAINNVVASNYTVTVTGSTGCTATETITVNATPSTVSLSASSTDALCGANNGSASVTATSGTAPYSYLWSNGGTSNAITGLASGTYTVTVLDANGCDATASQTINAPTPPTATAMITNVSCNGGSSGAINAMVSGGAAPFSYAWSNGATTEDISGLMAGIYAGTITDANNCSFVVNNLVVSEPTALGVTATTTNISCNGGSDGAINLSVTGGTGPYSYAWSNGATTEDISGLTSGSYSGTVTDANNCSGSLSFTLTAPAAISLSAITNNVSCNGGANGSINLNLSGGVLPYSYSWSNGAATQNVSGLVAGTYTGTITDGNGCTTTATASITEPTVLAISASATNISCNGAADGSINVTATGGTAPYSYNWSNGAATQNISGLVAGTYTGTITDGNGCTTTATASITEPTVLAVSASATNISCNGAADGSINVTATGGTAPYSYNWSNGAATQNISGLVAGTYTGTITDGNGCTTTATASITEPTVLAVSASTTNASCNGGTGGAINLTTSGGTAPYTYNWSNGATTEDISGLSAGSYSGSITDANGCTISANATITAPTAISFSATSVDVSCNGDADGSIDLTTSGGTAPYSYNWSNGATTEDISGLAAGTYSGTITDANGCTASANATITEPTAISFSATSVDVSCNGAADGSIDLTTSGGTAPYSYNWSNGATTEDISGLAAGTYSGTITDANGCTASASATITEPTVLSASTTVTDVSSNGGSDGAIDVTPAGGTMPYSYSWSTGDTGASLTGLTAGTYDVTVTDANGCTFSISETVTEPVSTATASMPYGLNIFPNPTRGLVNLDFDLNQATEVHIQVFSATGQLLRDLHRANIQNEQWQLDISEYPSGVYFFQINAGGHVSGHRVILQD